MKRELAITGMGAVSPAGWGVDPLVEAVRTGASYERVKLNPPTGAREEHEALMVPTRRDALTAHPRLRRAGRIAHFAASAAVEALGPERVEAIQNGRVRAGIVYTLMNGGVAYSRRFFAELQENPAMASPIIFPETVFNAPASHLAAFLGIRGPVNSLVGDESGFLGGLDMAALWLDLGLVDLCLVVGAEESDWLTAEGLDLLEPDSLLSEGAGCLVLEPAAVSSRCRLRPQLLRYLPRAEPSGLLVEGERPDMGSMPYGRLDWDGLVVSPRKALGQSLGAACSWQCVLAVNSIEAGQTDQAVVATAAGSQAIRAVEFVAPLRSIS